MSVPTISVPTRQTQDVWSAPTHLSRTQTWLNTHPVLLDCALVLLLDCWALGSILHAPQTRGWWPILISQLLVLPLALRRRWPWPVFAIVATVAAIQWLTDVPLAADAALVVALYTVAAYCSRGRALIAAGVIEVGVVLASARFAPTGDGVVASLVLLSGMVAAALFSGTTLRTRRQYLAALTERAIRLERERDQQARLAATAERTRIARELHDVIAHSLSVIITLADAAVLAGDLDPAREAMVQVAATGRGSMAEMRRLLGVLREDDHTDVELAPQPGLDRMDNLVGEVRATGLPVELITTGTPKTLPASEQSAAYRIVQEGLTNALKHADNPTLVRVQITWSEAALGIDIIDNGRPTRPGTAGHDHAGHGLVGMRERAGLFQGTVECGPSPFGGWQVRAVLPVGTEA